jgi:small conductance mechanosensitive channel
MRSARVTLPTLAIAVVAVVVLALVGVREALLHTGASGRVFAATTDGIVTGGVLVTTFVFVRVIGHAAAFLERSTVVTRHQREVVYRFVQLFAFGSAMLVVVLYVWELAITNVLLGAGVTSVVLALAARQTLTSVLSGLVIITTDVFRVGDWVKIDDRFGQITRISFFNTKVTSPKGEQHVFPNDELTAKDITTLGNKRYRNDVLVGIDYDTDIDQAIGVCDTVLEELTAVPTNHVDGYHPTTVKDFDDSQVTLAVKMWIDEPAPSAINQAQTTVFARLQQAFADEGIEIPFPQRTVSEREATRNGAPRQRCVPETTAVTRGDFDR